MEAPCFEQEPRSPPGLPENQGARANIPTLAEDKSADTMYQSGETTETDPERRGNNDDEEEEKEDDQA